jgi:predicted alpha/beta-fold hydrolase
MQTLAGYFFLRRFALPQGEDRLVTVEPGIQTLCQCHWQQDRTRALTVVILHGLEGSSDSGYVQGITQKSFAAGMNVVRMNQRNCGGTDKLAATLYHSGRSNDVATVARNLMETDKINRLALVGFSMGGNLVLKAAGEWGREAPPALRCVATVCPAIDLAASADALHQPANRLYEIYFLWKLRRRLLAKARFFPGEYDVTRLSGIRSLREFDDKITAYYCGFSGADDYYGRAAAANVVDQIAVPTLIVHAANDPFIRITAETRRKIVSNPNIRFLETADGGHCSFLGQPDGNDGYWAENQVVDFLRQF